MRHLYKTVSYNRQKGVLRKEDYVFISECLTKYLAQIQTQNIDNSIEIDKLKLLFIKLDHKISRM